MLNPRVLVDRQVELLRSIPELCDALGGGENILPYHDGEGRFSTLTQAIQDMRPPGMLVAWEGSGPAGSFGGREVWQHNFRFILRAELESSTGSTARYYEIWTAIAMGVPSEGDGNKMFRCEPFPNCYAMTTPAITRAFLITDPMTNEGLEFFEIRFSYSERGE